MVKRNADIAKLAGGYLFPEINRRKLQFLQQNPKAHLISLGIGDTTLPIPKSAVDGFVEAANRLGNRDTYTGYGPERGSPVLRGRIADVLYHGLVSPDEIFVSDGAKCDLGRLQALFGRNLSIALQDPAYPVYVDSAVLGGITGSYSEEVLGYAGITYMRCVPENGFFPELNKYPRTDLIYFCSPNNPTGTVATREQLEQLVAYAKTNRSIIVFDNAYSSYIQDPALPKSIFEIDGAREVAIEVGSFSKLAGFTGVRLGWTIVPKELKYDDGHSVKSDWERITSTIFNGASNIAQAGGAALLTPEGMQQAQDLISYYLTNAKLLRKKLEELNIAVYGGEHAPFLWVRFPGQHSWDVFEKLLNDAHLITTPGIGFGPSGESFVRLSALGKRSDIEEACQRLDRELNAKT
ncbi:MAG: LL-diaminopimelate aminotransferase [Chlamydiales bacterium]|nr:LL-diaminopimelate aminotransferase [Chlamydiales bacterium]